jgi:ubiquinone/menaquinone biosynthesis C-methylase UbiE
MMPRAQAEAANTGLEERLPMTEQQIRFDDGASYERTTGVWSKLAGNVFLDWLKPQSGLRWVDVGCGNGAFTELIFNRFAPTEVHGIDPSEAQLDFARTRAGARTAKFQLGDAIALPFSDDSFDVAVMALAIYFVPDPAKAVAEMARVVRPRGQIAMVQAAIYFKTTRGLIAMGGVEQGFLNRLARLAYVGSLS